MYSSKISSAVMPVVHCLWGDVFNF